VELLARAFPFLPIRALGVEKPTGPNVKSLESGHLPESEIDAMIGGARLLVFPSYYEGFGFPVVRGLAYGQTVVVRRSPLWRELAGLTRAPGRLVEYELPHELVRCVGQALSGEPVDALPLGGDLLDGASPPGWRDCARSMVTFVERMLDRVDFQAWQRRDRALSAALR
jgi:glycosyltransferase involved in cell wall biosynthesis